MAAVKRVDRVTSLSKQREYYSDFPTSFKISPVGDISRITNDVSIRQSIVNLVNTNKGERFFSDIGCDVRKMLFENMSPQSESLIESMIRETVDNYEPRAKVNNIIVKGDETIGSYDITIVFTIINTQEPTTINFILTRVS